MIYFLLPPSPATFANSVYAFISLSSAPASSETVPLVSHSMHRYSAALKSKISSHMDEWNMYKRYTNPYEYLHSPPPQYNSPVAKVSPISSFYFHSLEIYKVFPDILNPSPRIQQTYPNNSFTSFINICEQQKLQKKQGMTRSSSWPESSSSTKLEGIRTFHLSCDADANIKAIKHFRDNTSDQHFTMHYSTITDYIEFGADGTGNLLHPGNFDECCAKHRNSFDLITAFAKNNTDTYWMILWAQICYAICMQKSDGNFILRIFDCFTASMVDILYLLTGFYKEVKLAKLQTSRIGSSEKYLICRKFRGGDFADYYAVIRQSYYQMLHINATGHVITRFLNITPPKYFVQRIEEMNGVFGQPQLENIHYTLSLINKNAKYDRNDQIVRQNIMKCINWCMENGIPHIHPVLKSAAIIREEPTIVREEP